MKTCKREATKLNWKPGKKYQRIASAKAKLQIFAGRLTLHPAKFNKDENH
jgi:hypothetical protein